MMADGGKHGATEIIKTLDAEARRIAAVQRAIERGGGKADRDQIARASVFFYTADFIARLSPYADDIREMLQTQPGDAARALRYRRG